ncbi:MAG: hypothetical protein ABI550_01120 [Ignavibacteriaceae bacterium]
MNKKLLKFTMTALIILFNGFALTSAYQDNQSKQDKVASDMAQKLTEKVLLDENQAKKVEDILKDYISKKESDASKSELEILKNNIINLLDKKQKMKFEVVKDGWWNEIDTQISRSKAKD